jgi:Ni/Fe-hydrogenase subunit HybB-like protein
VKGAFVIAGYTVVLFLHFVASWAGSTSFQSWLMIFGIPLSVLTAVYTAYLFAQAKARDMWQNPLLPPHLLVQALLLGSAVLLGAASVFSSRPLLLGGSGAGILLIGNWILAVTSLIHLLMVWGEVSLTHPTAHARLAIHEMVHGRYRSDFWIGTILSFLGGLLPWLAILQVVSFQIGIAGAPLVLVGLVLFENAYVQSGQSVPLA